MQLIGQMIEHSALGQGVVTEWNDSRITISFSDGEKRFIFPDAFSKFLTLKNRTMQAKVQSLLDKRTAEEIKKASAAQRAQERQYFLRNLKISPCAQTVFHVLPGQKDDVFSTWSISTGRYTSGSSKGEPRIPVRMKPNSMCLLTECAEGKQEEERRIIGMFMVQEDFWGRYCQTGIINAHPEHRLRLPLEYQLLFWPYIVQQSKQNCWGKTPLKYITNEVGESILFDIKGLPLCEEDHIHAEKFYHYYCGLNHLHPKKEEAHPDKSEEALTE